MSVELSPAAAEVLAGRLRSVGCVFAEEEARLLASAAGSRAELEELSRQRLSGVPLEYVLGWVEFFGLRIAISPGVFVPRKRTEFLVREAIARASSGAKLLDLCCGSGAVGIAICSALEAADLWAGDIDPVAVRNARQNFALTGGRAFQGDLFSPIPDTLRGHVDVLTANVPYVPTEAIELLPRESRDFESRTSVDGGADGLGVLRRLVAGAPVWLAHGGHILFESGGDQAQAAAALVRDSGLAARIVTSDRFSSTVVIGTQLR